MVLLNKFILAWQEEVILLLQDKTERKRIKDKGNAQFCSTHFSFNTAFIGIDFLYPVPTERNH